VLRLVDDAWLSHYPGLFTGKGWLVFVLGQRALQVSPAKIHKREYAELRHQQRLVPVYIVTLNGLNYWQFQEHVFSDDQGLVAEQVYADLVGLATGETDRRIA
jgi:hypothetical protein